MASELKRKRGPTDILEQSKRSKSVKIKPESPNPKNILANLPPSALDAALNPPFNTLELVAIDAPSSKSSELPESEVEEVDGVDDNEEEDPKKNEQKPKKKKLTKEQKEAKRQKRENKIRRKAGQNARKRERQLAAAPWKVAESIGGRLIDADPVFTEDEKFIILANRTSINVYSTEDSTLTRSIKLRINEASQPNVRIITYYLSPHNKSLLWVTCSDGSVYNIDWTTGVGAEQFWSTSSTGCNYMTVASMKLAERRRDVVFTTEVSKDGTWRISAHELALPDDPITTTVKTIYSSKEHIKFLKTAREGSIIVGFAGNAIFVGYLKPSEHESIEKLKYEFKVFRSSETICSMDVMVSERTEKPGKKSNAKVHPVVDLVVGDVKGIVYLHNDLLQNLVLGSKGVDVNIKPRKDHWHRQEVHTVKFSLDGNYIISGGKETVLVLWQLETGRRTYLPHMSATIQSLVVSPLGTSYAIQLSDNSAIVLSTADLLPKTYIAGIQACVLDFAIPEGPQVKRVEEEMHESSVFQRTPAVISNFDPSKMFLGVGSVQEVTPEKSLVIGTPFLQTFDLTTGRNVSRQALTRSNITNKNYTPDGTRVSEPRVTQMKASFDGKWLATVDEWTHPKQDIEVEHLKRPEVNLKFWQWSEANHIWELVTRLENAHIGRILDLAADPSSLRFSTIGDDLVVRTWFPKTRKQDGVVLKDDDGTPLVNWGCRYAVPLAKPEPYDSDNPQKPLANGCVAFSDDGGMLAAAYGGDNQAPLHIINPEDGVIRRTYPHMYWGDIVRLEFLGRYLITLSDRLFVYDVVKGEMQYSFTLRSPPWTIQQKLEMTHLAVDRKSQTFALVLPRSLKKATSIRTAYSQLIVFDSEGPLLNQPFSSLITTLIPAAGLYITVDSAAEITTIFERGVHPITALAQSTSAQGLDDYNTVIPMLEKSLKSEVDDHMEIDSPTTIKLEDDAPDMPVVTQQQLSEIFDVEGGPFALPPMEELFKQVLNLYYPKTS